MIHTPKNSIKKPNCLKESPNNSVVSGSPMKKEIGVAKGVFLPILSAKFSGYMKILDHA